MTLEKSKNSIFILINIIFIRHDFQENRYYEAHYLLNYIIDFT